MFEKSYVPIDRKSTLPGGEEVTVAFSLSFVTHPLMPGCAWFVCQQHYPEHFWKPDYQRHANGARAMRRIWVQAENPSEHGDFLAALFAGAWLATGLLRAYLRYLGHDARGWRLGRNRGDVEALVPQVIERMKETGEIRLAVRKDAKPHSYVIGAAAKARVMV